MDVFAAVLTVLAVLLLWVAAVVFGRDTRDGRDWRPGSGIERAPHLGD